MIRTSSRRSVARVAFGGFACACAAAIAAPAAAFDPDAAYLIAWWDGRDTRPGLWFEIDGGAPPPSVRLSRVRHVPDGLEVRAESGRLTLSSELARLLDVAPGAPALIALSETVSAFPAEPAADPLALDSEHPAAVVAKGSAQESGASSYAALADHIARVEGLFGSMRADAERGDAVALSAAARRDAVAEEAPAVIEARRGGLVPHGWGPYGRDAGSFEENAP